LRAQEKTTWDGVYSEAQATKGQALYNDKCSKCHGQGAGGGDATGVGSHGFGVVALVRRSRRGERNA